MAPMHKFIRWLKDKTSTKGHNHHATIARLRKLPPVPPNGYEYGFRVSDSADIIHETHVYEEIPYEEIPANLRSDKNSSCDEGTVPDIVSTMQQLDFSSAKTVGPYLLVPIKKESKNSPDLIKDTTSENMSHEEYRSLYSMIPEWAKYQLKNASKKRHGLAISRGYSVDEPPSNDVQCPAEIKRCFQGDTTGKESPTILEKSHDSGHGSDDSSSDNGGYRRCSVGPGRSYRCTSTESLSDLDVFDDQLDKNSDYILIKAATNDGTADVSTASDISLTSVSSLDVSLHSNVCEAPTRRSKSSHHTEYNKHSPPAIANKYHIEAEALFDQLYQSSRHIKTQCSAPKSTAPAGPSHANHVPVPQVPRRRPNVEQRTKSDKSTGLSTSLRTRDDLTIPTAANSMTSHRLSCRITNVQITDSQRRKSMDFRTKSRSSSTSSSSSSSGVDSDYGSIYGPARGSIQCTHNRLLGDVMRMNHERQLMVPW